MSDQNKAIPINQLDPNMKWEVDGEGGLRWYDPMDEPFCINGFPWIECERKYRRLPLRPKFPIRKSVDHLANCTAGGQIRFRTDSPKLSIHVRLNGAANMHHMPATGQCGFDCYIDIDGRPRYHNTTKYNPILEEYEASLIDLKKQDLHEITLYFPLYKGVEDVRIGLVPEAEVSAPKPYRSDKRVIVYGTSVTQGGCASRPGMAYTNILSRRIPLEFINLGFSGNGRGEPEVAQLIGEIAHPACLILDYEGNCPTPEHFEQTLPEFIRIYRDLHPFVPILVLTKIRFARELLQTELLENRLRCQSIARQTVDRLKEQGDQEIYFMDGSLLLGDDYEECTVDGVHPTDLGFLRIADGLTPMLQKLLAEVL